VEIHEIRWKDMERINLVEDGATGMLVNTVMSCHVPRNTRASLNI
jgi:hypothetical protein